MVKQFLYSTALVNIEASPYFLFLSSFFISSSMYAAAGTLHFPHCRIINRIPSFLHQDWVHARISQFETRLKVKRSRFVTFTNLIILLASAFSSLSVWSPSDLCRVFRRLFTSCGLCGLSVLPKGKAAAGSLGSHFAYMFHEQLNIIKTHLLDMTCMRTWVERAADANPPPHTHTPRPPWTLLLSSLLIWLTSSAPWQPGLRPHSGLPLLPSNINMQWRYFCSKVYKSSLAEELSKSINHHQ